MKKRTFGCVFVCHGRSDRYDDINKKSCLSICRYTVFATHDNLWLFNNTI